MKLNGIFGTGSGKVGASVWAVSGGVQIVRPYQPNVSNPNTDAQVEQRAKLKLMSQLAAAFDGNWGFVKSGLVSARNKFISANIGKATYQDSKASVELTKIDLTAGTKSLPNVQLTKGTGDTLNVALGSAADVSLSAVKYVVVRQTESEKVEIVNAKLVTTAGQDRAFGTQFAGITESVIVYAFGVYFSNASSKAKFDNYRGLVDNDEAYVRTNESALLSGASYTETKAEYQEQ